MARERVEALREKFGERRGDTKVGFPDLRRDERIPELREVDLSKLNDILEALDELRDEKILLFLDPFKLAEFLGAGYRTFRWKNFRDTDKLPKEGDEVTWEIDVTTKDTIPTGEVWWLTGIMFADVPSSTFTWKVKTLNTEMKTRTKLEIETEEILFHEGWIATPYGHDGWLRADEKFIHTFKNVTGDTDYTDLPNQDITMKATCFIFAMQKQFADMIEFKMDKFQRDWRASTRKLAHRIADDFR